MKGGNWRAKVMALLAAALGVSLLLELLWVVRSVRRIAEGDLDARYSVEGFDELAALGSSFNDMAADQVRAALEKDGFVVAAAVDGEIRIHESASHQRRSATEDLSE